MTLHRRWSFCHLTLAVSVIAGAETPALQSSDLRREIDHIRGLALAAPPEIGADALLNLVEAGDFPTATSSWRC
jgi:hypothetical protein